MPIVIRRLIDETHRRRIEKRHYERVSKEYEKEEAPISPHASSYSRTAASGSLITSNSKFHIINAGAADKYNASALCQAVKGASPDLRFYKEREG